MKLYFNPIRIVQWRTKNNWIVKNENIPKRSTVYPHTCVDPETGCGLLLTGKKARLLIGRAHWFWNSIGPILAAAAKGTSMSSTAYTT